MRDLLIGKNVAYASDGAAGTIAGVWELDDLVDGSIAIVDNEGTLIADDAVSITKPYVELYTKIGTAVKKVGFPLYTGKTTYSKLAYAAPVAAVKYVGSDQAAAAGDYSLNLPATIAAGDRVGVSVTDLSKPMHEIGRTKEYVYTVVSGDVLTGKTSANIIARLVALINADPFRCVTASAVDDGTDNDGLKLTAKTAGKDFGVGLMEGVLEDADIVAYKDVNGVYTAASTTAVANNPGHGTYASILEMYKATASRDGNQQYMIYQDLLFGGDSGLSSTGTYTTYVFTTKVPNTDEISVSNNPDLTLVIAVPSGAAGVIAALDNLGAKIV
jgi:hypothetical protein